MKLFYHALACTALVTPITAHAQMMAQTAPESVVALSTVFMWILIPILLVLFLAIGIVAFIVYKTKPTPVTQNAAAAHTELVSYIQAQMSAGFTKEEIRSAVLAAGWKEEAIEAAFHSCVATEALPTTLAPGLGGKYVRSYKKIGLVLMILPPVAMICTLILYALTSFAGARFPLVSVLFGVIGLAALLGVLIGLPLGITFLVRRDERQLAQDIARARLLPQYKGLTDQELVYIHDWSWAAFFGSFVWLLGERLYLWTGLSILAYFVPFLPWVFAHGFGREGRRVAWERGWTSFQEFRHRQTVMAWIVGAVLLLFLILTPIFIVAIAMTQIAQY